MRLLPGFSSIRRELGKICSIGAMRDEYDLDHSQKLLAQNIERRVL